MSSAVAICNLALSHLGDEAQVVSIAPPDGSMQAALCGQFYPVARQAMLEMHPWSFAVTRVAIAATTNPAEDDWAYCYALPSLCLRPLSCLLPGTPERHFGDSTDAGSHPYVVETNEAGDKILLTNVETATLRYIRDVQDPTKFTPLFTLALARLLAAHLAGPILKGDKGTTVGTAQMRMFLTEFAQAAAKDANTGRRDFTPYRPGFLAARGPSA